MYYKFKWQQRTKRFILALMSLLTLVSILMTGVSSYAITPDGAYLGKIEGTGLAIGTSNSRDRKPATLQQKLRQNTILYVPGGNKPWAHLGFFQDSPLDSSGLLVKAGPSQIISEWSFPCSARGRFTIAWKKGSDRGCEAGVRVQGSSKRGMLPNNNLQASRRLLAQAEDEVTVVPTPGESIVQTTDNPAGIKIDVLVGEVRIKSAKNPEGRLVKAGERYDYPQDTITPIDNNSILNSPAMQDFLNPNNWSSPEIPQRVADGFSEQLGQMRTTLSQLPQQTARQSTQPQRTITTNSAPSLTGQWSFQYIGTPGMWTTPITQNGNRIEMLQSADGSMQKVEGTVSGNQIRVNWLGRNGGLVGTISEDGNTINGVLLPLPTSRDKENMQFTMTRQSSQASAQNNYCNSRTVTQPISSSNSHDGTSYQIWMDFSRGQEVSSAVCGRQYWVKEDPNHPNYQIRFVYLVDGKGKCVVPYLYKETDNGNLEVVRAAPECSSGS